MITSESMLQAARRRVSWGGTLCGALALVVLVSGCPQTTPCTMDADCDDDAFCNGAETCDAMTMVCVDGTAPCAQGQTCVEADDVCVDCVDDMDCEDGETCVEGECVPETPDPCEGVTCGACEECVEGDCVPLEGAVADGEAFYTANSCANCHGANGNDGFAPDLTDDDCASVFDKISGNVGHGGGTVAGVTEQDAADLRAWLASLGQ
jgi:hypothetical protein